MKKSLCFIAAFIFVAITMCSINASYAKSYGLAYEVCEKLDFEDLSKLSGISGSFDVQNGIFRADGNVLKVSDAKYSFLNKPLAGVFNLKFDLFVSNILNSCTISINSVDNQNTITLNKTNDDIDLIFNSASFASLKCGVWYEIEISFDDKSNLNISVLSDGTTLGESSLVLDGRFAFSDISFATDGGMYIDNLELSRPVIANGSSPVIYKTGSFIAAEAKPMTVDANKNMLVLASFDESDNLISSCVASGKDEKTLQAYMPYDKDVKTYKAFMWCVNLYPQGDAFEADNSSVYISQLNLQSIFDISISDKKAYINASDVTGFESVEAVLYGNGETQSKSFTKEELINGNAYFDMTDKAMGEYSICVSSVHEIYKTPLFEKSFLYRENVLENDTYIFKIGYPYYFHNNEKCFFSENKSYSPKFENGEMFVDKIIFKNLFALEPSGDESLFAVGNVMKELGYYTYFDKCGIYVVSLDSKWISDDIGESEVIFTEGFDGNNINMGMQYWGDSSVSLNYGKTSDEAKNGNYSYELGTVSSSFIGLKTVFRAYEQGEDVKGYKFSFWAKCSDDFSGNTLGGLALFYKGDVLSPHFPSLSTVTNEWQQYSFTVDVSKFADKDTMTLAVRLSNSDNAQCSGSVFIDDVVVSCIKSGSDTLKNYALEYAELFEKDYEVSEDFESDELNWQNFPKDWGCYNWGTGNHDGDYGIEVLDGNFGKSAYLGSVDKSFLGLQGPVTELDKNVKTYSMTADIYVTDDYNNSVFFAFLMHNENGFAALVKGTSVGNYIKKGQWNRVTAYFDTDEILNGEYVSFRPLIYTTPAASSEPTGRVYIDNVLVSTVGDVTDYIRANITNQNFASWHVLGENVVYKADANQFNGFDTVEGVVYNSINEEVFRKEVSVYTLSKDGWVWKPDITGYFEIEFYAVRSDKSRSLVVDEYTNSYKDISENFKLSRKSFAVAADYAKPIEERNKKLFVSSHATSDTDLKIASMLGFYGARIHWIRWGNSATVSGAHTGKGTYNWTNVDKQFENVKKSGFGAISANIYGTPQWATPEAHRNETANTIAGSVKYNNYAPEDMTNLTEFLEAFIDRYGEDVDIIEFWNEPQTGTTAFWNDSVENFAKMLKAAYTTIKEKSDITVSFAGMGNNDRYAQFYDELLDIEDIYNYYDIMAYHGTYNVSERLNNIATDNGFEPKKWQNSEGYFTNYSEFLKFTDKYAHAKRFVVSLLQNFKAGAEIITVFQMLNLSEEEYRVYTDKLGADTNLYGIFRNTPHIEPSLTAVSAFNLFDKIGLSFEYVGEDEFDDVRAVLFNNDGKAFVAMWSKTSNDFCVPDGLKDIGGNIIDFEGNTLENQTLDGRKLYYITDAYLQKASQVLGTDKNNVLNPAMESPYFNAEIN